MSEDDEFRVNDDHRTAAHRILDSWLDESERHGARRFQSGCSGHLGKLTVRASVNDDGISLYVERSFEEDL